jgi:hypothetical protein
MSVPLPNRVLGNWATNSLVWKVKESDEIARIGLAGLFLPFVGGVLMSHKVFNVFIKPKLIAKGYSTYSMLVTRIAVPIVLVGMILHVASRSIETRLQKIFDGQERNEIEKRMIEPYRELVIEADKKARYVA